MLIIVSTVFRLNSGFWMHKLEYLYMGSPLSTISLSTIPGMVQFRIVLIVGMSDELSAVVVTEC